jgi:hypothetical protein
MAATILTASRRANGGARRLAIVGLAVLAAIALGAAPVATPPLRHRVSVDS